MLKIPVPTASPYDVLVGSGLTAQAGKRTARILTPCRAAIISDDTVDALHGDKAENSFTEAGFTVCRMHFPHGEAQKNLHTYADILEFLCKNQITRTDMIVALGGGTVGDLAGFAAATYLRGIRFVQMPTTLLAMVDASVGGKTAVDLPQGKNLCGAFWQPSLVICDTDALETLPEETYRDGLAECFKHGVLSDESLFELLAAGDYRKNAEEMIARNIAVKASFVAGDERDKGKRQLLNLGHTLGHAAEKLSGYTLTHGRAVAAGMACAARIALKLGICTPDVPERIEAALRGAGLPVTLPYSAQALTEIALGDKKRDGSVLRLVLPQGIGKCILHDADVRSLREIIAAGVDE
ncbi:MAG: 3-dehydroquinate synthase [Clostridia bacterium]|nr:3-dehydroquinate synthase [Clostridia bacterium]